MLLSLFALGTLWFWILIIASIIGIVALVENEKNFWADVVFFLTITLLYKMGCSESISSIGSWIIHNPVNTILIFLGYLILGTLYSLLKWAIFMVEVKKEHIRKGRTYYPENYTPSEHKAKITHWMIYWPISGLWTLMSNPVAKAFNRIFEEFEGVYQKITDKIMKEIVEKQNKNK